MQTKLVIALCIVNILINVTVIGGCIYEKQQYETTIHSQKQQIIRPKEQIENSPKKVETETDRG